ARRTQAAPGGVELTTKRPCPQTEGRAAVTCRRSALDGATVDEHLVQHRMRIRRLQLHELRRGDRGSTRRRRRRRERELAEQHLLQLPTILQVDLTTDQTRDLLGRGERGGSDRCGADAAL